MKRSIVEKVNVMKRHSSVPVTDTADVRDLLMFRVARLVTIGERTGQLRMSREFGLNLGEWRVLGLIRALEPITLAELARELFQDKGQLSRSVSDLIDRGFVSPRTNPKDGRQRFFELTTEGHRLHDCVLQFALARNADLMSSLGRNEKAELFRLLAKLTAAAVRSYNATFKATPERPIKSAPSAAALSSRIQGGGRGPPGRQGLRT